MNRRKRNNIIIGALCCALVFIGVGYAALNTVLTINTTASTSGNFDIHFSAKIVNCTACALYTCLNHTISYITPTSL